MQVYVKETLHILDYQNNIVGTIFNSDDHITPGYAYNITITEANTGYSDLKFDMPNTIINDNGDKIKNPLLALLTPLVKLRYHREVYYMGNKPITVREPVGYGDTTTYVDKTYSNEYPDNIIEDYLMDYIVQPIDKQRDVLAINTSFTAMDYPRFNLSKKRVGLTIAPETLTRPEWSIYNNEPLDEPGKIKYVQWNQSLSVDAGNPDIPLVWDPKNALEYPLNRDAIDELKHNVVDWPYGLLCTIFYWPIVSTARFKGIMYKKGGYLTLTLYDFYNLTTAGIDTDLYIDDKGWEWGQLNEVQSLLCPNNALNYLCHILDGTNWTVALREDGVTPDVDIIQTTVSNPKGSTTSKETVDLQSNISISGGNCYNAITTLCQELQVYPIFDCVNRTVALRQFAGKNYGLVYSLGNNLKDNTIKNDGEKVITKLYCTGAQDNKSNININIGPAERSHVQSFVGFYSDSSSLPTADIDGYYAIVDDIFQDNDICLDCGYMAAHGSFNECPVCHGSNIQQYNFQKPDYAYEEVDGKMEIVKHYSATETVHDLSVPNYWQTGINRQVYYWDGTQWNLGTQLPTGLWEINTESGTVIVDPVTGTTGEWDPNDDMYIINRSPYGTNYILNLEWSYKNKWITREQILELYQYEQQIDELNELFEDKYTEDKKNTLTLYFTAVNEYDISQGTYESTLQTMENKYYNVDGEYSKGYTFCFHKSPQGTYLKYNIDKQKNTYFMKLFHCYECGWTEGLQPNEGNEPSDQTTCPICNGLDVSNQEIYVPVYDDYTFTYNHDIYPYTTDTTVYNDGSYRYCPHSKGDYLSMVIALDKMVRGENSTPSQIEELPWDIKDYEENISLIEEIPFVGDDVTWFDGYDYKVKSYYVRSTSGLIENWNKDISQYLTSYGKMLDDLRVVDATTERIRELNELYDSWDRQIKDLHATIQEKFGDYLVEGNYTNNEQPFVALLFNEGLEASDKYAIPEVTYTLNVVDASGLVEYREPTITRYICAECGHVSYVPLEQCPYCGSSLFNIENDVYNDLIRLLHSIGQIVPKAGDYVTIYDEPMGMFGVPGLITQIVRYVDNPINNKIEINTSYTDDEELVGNIITATNTVLNNSDIYARTAILKSDGTIDPNSITETLNTNSNNIAIVGTSGNMLLDSTGMRVTNATDSNKAIKYSGDGIYTTSNFSTDDNEAVVWEALFDGEGINASKISSGSIDTRKLSISSGQYSKVVLDQYGLSVKNDTTKLSHVMPFDKELALSRASYASDWGTNNNIVSFVGVDATNNPLIYTKGFLVANEGSNIANWITSDDGFYHLNGNTKDLWLSPSGINGVVNNSGTQSFALYAGGKFGVTTNGILWANGAYIAGTVEVGTGSSIGGLDVTNYGLEGDSEKIVVSPSGYPGRITISNSLYSDGPWAIYSKGNFGVTIDGTLWAKNGKFGGQIEAGSGHIGGWTIDGTDIKYGSTSVLHGATGRIETSNFYGTGGTIAGWKFDSNHFYNTLTDSSHIYADGRCDFRDNGWLNAGRAGYWLLGNGASYRCLVGDAFEMGNNIADALGTVHDATPTVGIAAKNGNIHIRNYHSGGFTRMATMSSGGIAIEAGYAGTNYAGQVYIAGNASGDGKTSAGSSIMMYSPNGSIRLNAKTNVWCLSHGSIILEAQGNGCIVAGNFNLGESSDYGRAAVGRIGYSGTALYLKGQPYNSSSSKNMKTNINLITNEEKEEIYNIIKETPFYSFNYKPEYGDADNLYHGFIIEDLENTKVADYLHFIQDDQDPNIKNFNGLELSKMNLLLIQQLQKKVEALEQQLKKEKTN